MRGSAASLRDIAGFLHRCFSSAVAGRTAAFPTGFPSSLAQPPPTCHIARGISTWNGSFHSDRRAPATIREFYCQGNASSRQLIAPFSAAVPTLARGLVLDQRPHPGSHPATLTSSRHLHRFDQAAGFRSLANTADDGKPAAAGLQDQVPTLSVMNSAQPSDAYSQQLPAIRSPTHGNFTQACASAGR